MFSVSTQRTRRCRTGAALYTYALECGAVAAFTGVVVAVLASVAFGGSGFLALALGTVGAIGGTTRGAMVSVTVDDDVVVVRNPLRTRTIAASKIERVVVGHPWLTPASGWAPSLVTTTRDRPLLLAGLLVPLWQFQTRRPGLAGLLVPIWRFDGCRTPDATYRSADRFDPLAHLVESNQIPVAPQWSQLLTTRG